MVRIILIRHGETTWNTEGRYQGQEDTPLSERGIRQGMACAEGLKDIHIDRAISSPLSRSYETCRMAAEKHGLVVEKDERLTEISHGLWEGIHADEIEARYPESFYLWHTHPEKVQMPEGECWKMSGNVSALLLTNMQKSMTGKPSSSQRTMQ